nr:HlyD family efflux transporter periplasmic adaptor subunit [uncultured Rhodopila sp.]
MTRRTWLAIVLLLAAGAGVGWWWNARRPAPIAWQGYAEADFVKVGPTQQGLLTAVLVARGEQVQAGTLLLTQDDADDRAARDQAAQMLAQAEQTLGNLLQGGKPTEIAQAEANLADARAVLARATADQARGEAQLPMGGVSRQTVDELRADRLSAQAKLEAAQAALMQARAPMGRDGEILAQRASVAAAHAALGMAEWRLAQRRVIAPVGGRVADVMARAGETMAAGAPVVSLLPPGNIFVRFFVPEPLFATIHPGDRVALACDGCAANLSARISFVSPQAEYTPPLIYSESSKAKLVFIVEARPPAEQAEGLNPGEPVEVRPVGVPAS